MKKLLLIATYFILPMASASPVGQFKFNEKVCGALVYTQGNYVLQADSEENYTVRESKLDLQDFHLTKKMQSIVMNHDYNESNSPQVCFIEMGSERISAGELDVLSLEDVQLRKVLN